MMAKQTICPTYNSIEEGVANIAKRITKSTAPSYPDFIVGLSRGGLIPGVMLSHILNIPFIPVCYSSKRGKGDDKYNLTYLPPIKARRILLIDDICDSGHTMNDVSDYYTPSLEIETASLYVKEDSVIQPTYYWKFLKADDPWIDFPWEI